LLLQWTGINQSFATAVMTFAVPSSMVPLPLTCLAFGAFLVEASAYQTGAIFIAMITAHACTMGLGVLHRVMGAPTLGSWLDDVPSFHEELEYGQYQAETKPAAGVGGCPERPSVDAEKGGDAADNTSELHTRLLIATASGSSTRA
jgi:hypothetical protein